MSASENQFPRLFRVRQKLADQPVADIPRRVQSELQRLDLQHSVSPGQSVAVTVGSRGIANIALITKELVSFLSSLGAKPFIVPAMGSHGGATADGQRAVIEGYGITEDYCGCPIRSNMETVMVCQSKEGFPVCFDKLAFEADHVVVAGRIKPHTDFTGAIESGLMKMMLIGLGKQNGARVYHSAIQDYNFDQIVRSVGREVIKRCRILAGVAIVEDGLDQTAHIEAVAPEQFESREPELLVMAKELMPKLPFREAGLLVVDEIGKNISGAGMDTNIVGRKYNDHAAIDGEWPKIKRIAVRSLTKETHGNATGIGIAEFCLRRAIDQMNYEMTRINCVTSGHITAGMYPVYFENDQELLTAALSTIGLVSPQNAKMMWIKNTLDLLEVECSEEFWDEAQARDDLEIVGALTDIEFDQQGKRVFS